MSVLPFGLDPGYFSPAEAAKLDMQLVPGERSSPSLDITFFQQALDTNLQPGETKRGFIFSALDEGTKAFNVGIVGEEWFSTFTFFIPLPPMLES